MKFKYQARDKEGKEIGGECEATDRFALARELRAEGQTIISAQPVVDSTVAALRQFFGGSVKMHDKIIFASNLSAMVSAGLSLSRAFTVMERQTKNKRFKSVIKGLATRLSGGDSLATALSIYPEVFPPVFTAMVLAGEESGKLPQALQVVADQLTRSYDLRRKVRGAMIYPAIIVAVIIIIGILMMIFLVPNLTAIFKDMGAELPLSTRVVIATSDFLSQHTLWALGGLLVLVGLVIAFFRSARGKLAKDYLAIHLPLIHPVVHKVNGAVTMRTLSSLLSSGVGMVEALHITGQVIQNHYYQAILAEGATAVEKGKPLSAIFKQNEKLYPVLVGEMIEVGEETGKLSELLLKGALFYEDEVSQATKNLSTIIEPLLMVLIGIAVGFFAVSMIGPIYSLSDAL
ncbi:MAG: type II secretion system F family protein [Candidatus Vogelbacteria bacterium]